MHNNFIQMLFSEWTEEIELSLLNNKSLCVALFSCEGELLFVNPAMSSLFHDDPIKSFINPAFEKLSGLSGSTSKVYEGFITIGDYSSVNTSILAHVFKKNDKLLIIGGVDVDQLSLQNINLHHLNREINNLQRQLIKEKHTLQDTLMQLNEANNELKELVATKDKLFSIIAHDLKNPFNVLLGFSELLVENVHQYPPEKTQVFAQNIYDSSKQTYTLLENLLKWSHVQTGKLVPLLNKIKASDVVQEVISVCQDNAYSKDIDLQVFEECDEYIRADEEMLKTILRNLITNALKFTFPGGKIEVRTRCQEYNLMFIVSDTGFGIEPTHLKSLFSINCNLSKKGTANEKGSGLGLILCKEQNGGQIWAESHPGKGSDFKFTIPLWR
jgi:two-component system sensor histidine kinase/response regulator